MIDKTIVDIGAHNGDDIDFYIKKGFKVVAVEANINLYNHICNRFVDQIKDEILTVHNVAISNRTGSAKFYLNKEKTDWSSLFSTSKATQTEHSVYDVRVVKLKDILKDIENTYYIKLDIEGGELDALKSIDNTCKLPTYISVENNWDRVDMLTRMIDLGYNEFTVIRQGKDWLPKPKFPPKEGIYCDYTFTSNHSGMFGLELEGQWMSADEFLNYKKDEFIEWEANNRPGHTPYGPGWYDIHARIKA